MNQTMRRWYFLLLIPILWSCKSSRDKQAESIAKMHDDLYKNETSVKDTALARKLDVAYKEFVEKYPEDTMSPIYLYSDAQLQQNILTNIDEADVQYQRLVVKFPKHKLAPDALFSLAFNHEKLGNIDLAKKLYKDFLERYPDSELADDARFSLESSGKSLEDVVKGFKQQDSTRNAADTTKKPL